MKRVREKHVALKGISPQSPHPALRLLRSAPETPKAQTSSGVPTTPATSFAEPEALAHLQRDLLYPGTRTSEKGWVGRSRIGAHPSFGRTHGQAAEAGRGQRGPAWEIALGGTGQAGPGELRKVKEGLCRLAALQGPCAGGERGSDSCVSEGDGKGLGPAPAEGGQSATEPPGKMDPNAGSVVGMKCKKGSYLRYTPSPMGTWAACGRRVSKRASAPWGCTGARRAGSTGLDTPGRRRGPWQAARDTGFRAGIHGFHSKVQLPAATPKP